MVTLKEWESMSPEYRQMYTDEVTRANKYVRRSNVCFGITAVGAAAAATGWIVSWTYSAIADAHKKNANSIVQSVIDK